MRQLIRVLALALGLLLGATASASAQGVLSAIRDLDLPGLRKAAAKASEPERKLAAAVELAWLHRDEAARTALIAVGEMAAPMNVRAAAAEMLVNVEHRLGNYRGAEEAMNAFNALERNGPRGRDRSSALANVPAMVGPTPTSGRIAINRDMIGLLRAKVSVNGAEEWAMLDTGAGSSVIAESIADKFKLKRLDGSIQLLTFSKDALPAKLALADRLKIGGAEFRNVVFWVLPDNDVHLLGGIYGLKLIVGHPVIQRLGRIETVNEKGALFVDFKRSNAPLSSQPNILMDSSGIVAMMTIKGDDKARPVRMMVDTGAGGSIFNSRFSQDFPERIAKALPIPSFMGGFGGHTFRITKIVGATPLMIGDRVGVATGLQQDAFELEGLHGILGQDILKNGFIIDWEAMRFELKAPPENPLAKFFGVKPPG